MSPLPELSGASDHGLAVDQAKLGLALREKGQFQAAADALRKAAMLAPDKAQVWTDLGMTLRDLNDLAGSEATYRAALDVQADFAPAHLGLGVTLKAQGRLREAAASFRQAIRADPDHAFAYSNLGNTLAALGRDTAALTAYRAAIKRKPDYADAYSNMGVLLRGLGRSKAASAALNKAVALAPGSATAAFNLANFLAGEGLDSAEAAYERAIALRPQWASAHLNYALWLLREGRYERGWTEYEWRWAQPQARAMAERFSQPRWTGQPVDGKVVLVFAEQGLGDMIQCARYIPLLAARGAQVLVEAPRTLHDLLRTLPGLDRIVSAGDWIERLDYQCPAFSLPFAFGTKLADVPADTPYLHPPSDLVARWAERLPGGRLVGVVWQGNAGSRVDKGRSFPLAALRPLAAAADVNFVSLQRDHGLDQLDQADVPFPILRLGADFDQGTMAHTAAVIANLDLVIACDTAVAHLAGALGRPVWIALKRQAEWRWLRDRQGSPWYPSARLYRQTSDGDWAGLFEAMAKDLIET